MKELNTLLATVMTLGALGFGACCVASGLQGGLKTGSSREALVAGVTALLFSLVPMAFLVRDWRESRRSKDDR